MKESKVFNVIRILSIYDRNRLRKFLASPYFNANVAICQIFDLIDKAIKKQEIDELENEIIWKKIYNTEAFHPAKFRKLNSDLLKLTEDFLAMEQYHNNPLHIANYLLEAITNRKIKKLHNTTLSRVRRLSSQQLERPASYYFHQYQMEYNAYHLTSEFEKKAKSAKLESGVNISKISKNLDLFYLAEKLRHICTVLNWKLISNEDEEILYFEDTIRKVEELDFENIPPIAIYYQIYLTFINPEHNPHYFQLKELMEKYLNLFPKREAKDIFESALNYCIRKINSGEDGFQSELFQLYRYGLKSELLLDDNHLSPTSFRNIVFVALRENDFTWTETFITQYGPLIEERFRQNAVNFSLARLHWYKKDYSEVLKLLQDVEYNDIWYDLNAKSLLLAVYYELDETEALLSFANAFSKFLRRSKSIHSSRKPHFLHLIRFVKKMSTIHIKDKEGISKLSEQIQNTKGVVNKPWLLEKIEELKN